MYADDGSVAGSELIARNVTDPRYFHPRPSAVDYNASGSGGSNLGPTNPLLLERVNASVSALRASGVTGPVPAELVMASASGLDPAPLGRGRPGPGPARRGGPEPFGRRGARPSCSPTGSPTRCRSTPST